MMASDQGDIAKVQGLFTEFQQYDKNAGYGQSFGHKLFDEGVGILVKNYSPEVKEFLLTEMLKNIKSLPAVNAKQVFDDLLSYPQGVELFRKILKRELGKDLKGRNPFENLYRDRRFSGNALLDTEFAKQYLKSHQAREDYAELMSNHALETKKLFDLGLRPILDDANLAQYTGLFYQADERWEAHESVIAKMLQEKFDQHEYSSIQEILDMPAMQTYLKNEGGRPKPMPALTNFIKNLLLKGPEDQAINEILQKIIQGLGFNAEMAEFFLITYREQDQKVDNDGMKENLKKLILAYFEKDKPERQWDDKFLDSAKAIPYEDVVGKLGLKLGPKRGW